MEKKNRLGDILLSWNLISQRDLESALREQKEKGGFLGQIFINKGLVSSSDISRALQLLSLSIKEKNELGQMLVLDKLITEEQLKTALEREKTTKQSLEDALVDLGLLTSSQAAQAFSRYLGFPFISLSDYEVKAEILQLLPENIIRNYQIIPVKLEQDTLYVAMADPLNLIAVDEIRMLSK
jgi:type IV pilus assembly protein PilB